MKVKDLIKELENLDQEDDIFIDIQYSQRDEKGSTGKMYTINEVGSFAGVSCIKADEY